MLTSLLVILTANSVYCQINGEFWWLNKKLNDYRNVPPTEPIIEDLDDSVNDENSKIVFRNDDLLTNKLAELNHTIKNQKLYEYTSGKIVWPTSESGTNNDVVKPNMDIAKSKDQKNDKEDEFVFNFPKNEKYVINKKNTTKIVPQTAIQTESAVSSEIMFSDDIISSYMDKDAQYICTHMKKKKCFQNNGFIYSEWKQNDRGDQGIVCCVLPIQPLPKSDGHSLISFPGETSRKLRHKRSDIGDLDQRNVLLLRKFSHHQKIQLAPNPTPKSITPSEDEYVDPYWNIKNSKFQTQESQKIVTPSYNYDNGDYDDYASELPRPGLIGLYSDHAKAPSSWSFTSNTGFSYGSVPGDYEDDDNDDNDDDSNNTFGYSTIDPRKVSGKKKHKEKPVKFTTVSGEVTLDAESHTVNFQSNPDFQVLQGFKLLNLFRNRSRFYTKKRKTTAERNDDSKEFLGARPAESVEIEDQFFEEDQLFGGCGKAVAIKANDKEKQLGDASNGSHPWMALVVLTKTRHNVLCYATLIHPRAAITVADCVQGASSRDVTVIAGAWDLNNKSRLKTRIADIQYHPRYKPGEDDNNLAVLYWMRPLKLGANTQPACLGEAHIGDSCRFFGWGSLDQGIQTRSKWQRASIRMCDSRKLKQRSKPSDNFCADVSRGSVTSMGGPLICDIEGHNSVVGVVMSRDDGYLLIPVREFAMGSIELVTGD